MHLRLALNTPAPLAMNRPFRHTARPLQFKIEPFRIRQETDPQYAEKMWTVIDKAIDDIFGHSASGLSYEELYRNAYYMVLHKFGDKLYAGVEGKVRHRLAGVLASVSAEDGAGLLRATIKHWEEHVKAMQTIRDILMYMDRTYVVQAGRPAVFALGVSLWREGVVQPLHKRLIDATLSMIQADRRGDAIDRPLLRSAVRVWADLGAHVYTEDFEDPLIEATAAFYRDEAEALLGERDCGAYLRRAEERLTQEQARVQEYLDPSTEGRLLRTVQAELVNARMAELVGMENTGMAAMLSASRAEDLQRMFRLLSRAQDGLRLMRTVLGRHVTAEGTAAAAAGAAAAGAAGSGAGDGEDARREQIAQAQQQRAPAELVQALLDLRIKYDGLVATVFNGDRQFRSALNAAFEKVLNAASGFAEALSLYIDAKLRKGIKGMSDEEVEGVLEGVLRLFRHLQDKDLFERYYRSHLAKRLLSGRTVSDDAERSMLQKLKAECGYQYTSKLESMFLDVRTSADTLRAFRAQRGDAARIHGVDLTVQVLTLGSWPSRPEGGAGDAAAAADAVQPWLPVEAQACCKEFADFYLGAHSGRKLQWQLALGTADVRFEANGKRYDLAVSTHQMCVLMLFNDRERMTLAEIREATGMEAGDLERCLQSLACVKGRNVLRKEPMSKDVREGDVFSVNDKFESKLKRVRIGMVAAQREGERERQQTLEVLDQHRKPLVEAAVMRVMKGRRRMEHSALVAEVARQLAPRFVAQPARIKQCLESLIEREYIERDDGDRSVYTYIS
ncbi:unnamed protein product [Pedinophyceae sp. YPF-701]|nr:unnamed protein product [Pedinophyceae sp. YPF-701]